MGITDEQHFRGLIDALSNDLKRLRELDRRFRAYGLMPDGLSGVPDEELLREVKRRGFGHHLGGACRDRCWRGYGWRYCKLDEGHAGTHTDGEASWRAGHDGPDPVAVTAKATEDGGS